MSKSRSFIYTHSIVAQLIEFQDWTMKESEELFSIAINNSQVGCILNDADVKKLYQNLLQLSKSLSENARKVKDMIHE